MGRRAHTCHAPRLATAALLACALGSGAVGGARADAEEPPPAAEADTSASADDANVDDANVDDANVDDANVDDANANANAHDASRVRWDPAWPRFQSWQYGVLGGLLATQLYLEFGPGTNTGAPRIKGLLPLDDEMRELVLLDSLADQSRVDHASDFTWYGTLLFPLYADAALAAWAVHGAGDVAWQLALISTQIALTVSILTRLSHLIVQRQRPLFYYAERAGEPRPTINTAESLSFISGHAALAFAGAGLTCRFHQHLPLFGAPWADTAACVGTLLTATATGLFRMMSDRHFFSDTLIAAALGLSVGYYLPALLHFDAGDDARGLRLTPWASRNAGGFALVGVW